MKRVTFCRFNCCGDIGRCYSQDIEIKIFVENAEELLLLITKMDYRRWLPGTTGQLEVLGATRWVTFAEEAPHDLEHLRQILEWNHDPGCCGGSGMDQYRLINRAGENIRMVAVDP
jgi:hypothetical protein